jgi:hypothetical protein
MEPSSSSPCSKRNTYTRSDTCRKKSPAARRHQNTLQASHDRSMIQLKPPISCTSPSVLRATLLGHPIILPGCWHGVNSGCCAMHIEMHIAQTLRYLRCTAVTHTARSNGIPDACCNVDTPPPASPKTRPSAQTAHAGSKRLTVVRQNGHCAGLHAIVQRRRAHSRQSEWAHAATRTLASESMQIAHSVSSKLLMPSSLATPGTGAAPASRSPPRAARKLAPLTPPSDRRLRARRPESRTPPLVSCARAPRPRPDALP